MDNFFKHFFGIIKYTLFFLGFISFIFGALLLIYGVKNGMTDNAQTNAMALQTVILFIIASILLMGFFQDSSGKGD